MVAGNTPYGTFNNYLALLASGSLPATGTLTNQAPGALPGGQGAIGGFSGTGMFSGTTVAASYPVVIEIGADLVTANPPNAPLQMTNFINQVPGIPQGTYSWTDGGIISLALTSPGTGTNWQQMDADCAGAASSTIAQKVYGDFAQGMLAGLVGNPNSLSGTP